MKMTLAAFLLALSLNASAADNKPWKNAVELSFVSANGNSKTQTTSAKEVLTYDFSAETHGALEVGGLGARSEGRVTAEQYFAEEKMTQKISDRNYVFERYRWERNIFAGILHHHDASIGGGRELWKTDSDLLIGELAPGYLNEERLNERRKDFASARAYAKYTRKLSDTSSFSQDADYTLSLKDARDARLNTETALTAALTTSLSIKNSFIWRHDGRPPTGKRKDDTILSVALIANF